MISSKNISEENTNDKNIEDLYAKVIRRKKPKNTSIQETILMVECKPNEILNETTTSDQLSTIHQENQSNEITNVEPSNTIYQEISLNEITNIDKLNRMYQDSQPNVIPTANIVTRFTERNSCLKLIHNLSSSYIVFFVFMYALLALYFVNSHLVFKSFYFSIVYIVLFCILFLMNILFLFKKGRTFDILLSSIFITIFTIVNAISFMFISIKDIYKN
ncbi:hypothetical protein CWI37_0483p0010 [Hamiltosporidium tvaerminnensis]|uniref:Transmembrane protein n=2 Tax=Hamiltosporidium TaxID=1176354 RepID=A0A4Q9L2F9_9MICR|nr:hypothetical protein CWI39_1348p0010 [Hamiltosporidium magnivora]TBU02434.1 hypothetical protein CWI37_0483p0010 [Hamiltosporidium tvaerminnensis]